jgi:hypothetical protein
MTIIMAALFVRNKYCVVMSYDEIPQGKEPADLETRRHIISRFYREWKEKNPTLRKYDNVGCTSVGCNID